MTIPRRRIVSSVLSLFIFLAVATPLFAQAQTRDELLSQLAELRAQLTELIAETTASSFVGTFTRDLWWGEQGAEVLLLQQVLNTNDATRITATGAGSAGSETTFFGDLTKQGMIRFQELHRDEILTPLDLTSGTGFVGAATRVVLNRVLADLRTAMRSTSEDKGTAGTATPSASSPSRSSGSGSSGGGGGGGGTGPTPDVPTGLALDAGDGEIELSWTDPDADDLDRITIYRGTTPDALSEIASVDPGTEEYTDTPLLNDTTYYYALTATSIYSQTSERTAVVSDTTVGLFDIYVSSETGDDSNDGTSDLMAFATLGAAQTAAIAEGDGVKIGLKRGSEWREELNLAGLDNVAVAAYGAGNLPTLDASTVVAGWVQHDASTYPNVWSASIDHDISQNTSRLAIYEVSGGSTVPLVGKSSISAVNSATASRSSPSDGSLVANNPATVYIHTTDGSNPNANGKEYRATIRDYGLSLGSGASVSNLRMRFNGNNDGAMRVGGAVASPGTFRNLILEWGTKHNTVVDAGEMTDTALIFHDDGTPVDSTNGILGIYTNSAAGQSFTARNVHIIATEDESSRRSGWSQPLTMHDSVGGTYSTFRWYGGSLRGTSRDGFGGADDAVIDGLFVDRTANALTPADANSGGETSYVRRVMMRLDLTPSTLMSGVNLSRSDVAYEDTVIYATTMATSDPLLFWNSSFATQLALTGVVYYTPSSTAFIRQSTSVHAGTLASINRSIFVVPAGAEIISSLSSDQKTGSRNIFIRNINAATTTTTGIAGDDNINITRVNIAEYLSMCDISSTGNAQQDVDLLVDNLFLNGRTGMVNGDFRLNPTTTACMEFPDGVSVADANVGPQSHWDHNAGASVAGAPSAWPNSPKNLSDALEFVADPDGWEF